MIKTSKNAISRNWFIWFHEFYCLNFFKLSGPLWNPKKVQFRESELFASKAKVNVFWHFFRTEPSQRDSLIWEKGKLFKKYIDFSQFLRLLCNCSYMQTFCYFNISPFLEHCVCCDLPWKKSHWSCLVLLY